MLDNTLIGCALQIKLGMVYLVLENTVTSYVFGVSSPVKKQALTYNVEYLLHISGGREAVLMTEPIKHINYPLTMYIFTGYSE